MTLHTTLVALEIFIPFERIKRYTKRKYFVVWVASHLTYNIVMCKRVKLNSYEPFVRDKNMKFVTHSWYNKTLSFGTPIEFLKTYIIFQCKVPCFRACTVQYLWCVYIGSRLPWILIPNEGLIVFKCLLFCLSKKKGGVCRHFLFSCQTTFFEV